jgi:lipoprotein NlpD
VALLGRPARLLVLSVLLLTAACAPWQPTPSRGGEGAGSASERSAESPPAWYRVERGDTLYSIAFRFGLDWRNVARWNGVGAPYTIRPGQELRMSAPPRPSPAPDREESPPAESSRPQPAPPASEPEAAGPEAGAGSESGASAGAAQPSPAPSGSTAASGPTRSVGGVSWRWPTEGRVSRPFDAAATRKGIGIAGSEGQPVHAAASGEVVYSGTALIGYGELIIIKHSEKLLSAYGHNRRRLVAEGDRVERGQKIGEMGLNDRQEDMLHFEIRLDGRPVNPLDYLPAR